MHLAAVVNDHVVSIHARAVLRERPAHIVPDHDSNEVSIHARAV